MKADKSSRPRCVVPIRASASSNTGDIEVFTDEFPSNSTDFDMGIGGNGDKKKKEEIFRPPTPHCPIALHQL